MLLLAVTDNMCVATNSHPPRNNAAGLSNNEKLYPQAKEGFGHFLLGAERLLQAYPREHMELDRRDCAQGLRLGGLGVSNAFVAVSTSP
jgi:hypothetical protein